MVSLGKKVVLGGGVGEEVEEGRRGGGGEKWCWEEGGMEEGRGRGADGEVRHSQTRRIRRRPLHKFILSRHVISNQRKRSLGLDLDLDKRFRILSLGCGSRISTSKEVVFKTTNRRLLRGKTANQCTTYHKRHTEALCAPDL